MHKKSAVNKKTVIAVILIGAGCALAAAVGCSFLSSSFNNRQNEKMFESIRSTVATTAANDNSTNPTKKGSNTDSDGQNSGTDYYSDKSSGNAKMTIDSKKLYEDSIKYNENLEAQQSSLLTSAKSYTYSALKLTDYGITNGVYAYVQADSIGLNLPIYLGANDTNMAYGAAHLCYTSLPTGGSNSNVVLSGHTGYIGRWLFDSIPSLKTGDTVTIKNYWGDTSYKVVKKVTRTPDDGQDMFITKGKDRLTLITCVSNGKGGYNRCVVICER